MALHTIWLVRHGESVGNQAATSAERAGLERIELDLRDADVPLSDVGIEQAEALGAWITEHRTGIDVFFVSPYRRARQTLEIAAADLDAPARVDERLRDRELGVLDLLTWRGVQARYPEEAERRRRLGKYYHRPPGGESWADVQLRLRSFLHDALATPEGTAMVVAHDAVVMLVVAALLGMTEEELMPFAAEHTVLNASLTCLELTEEGWQLAVFSDVDHLQREGADVTVHPGSPDVDHA